MTSAPASDATDARRDGARAVLAAACVFAAALALRLVYLGADLFHTDSVHQALAVERWVLSGEFAYMHRPGYPGQVLLAAPFFWLDHALRGATSAAFAVTLESAVAGALAAALAVLLARRFLRTWTGALAAGVLVAVLPTFLSVTTYAMSHGSQLALLLGAALVADGAGPRLGRTAVTGLLCGLAVATRTESVFALPAVALLLARADAPVAFDGTRGFHLRVPARAFALRVAAFALPVVLVPLLLYAKQFATSGTAAWDEAASDTAWLGPFSPVLPLAARGARVTWTWPGLALVAVGAWCLARTSREHARAFGLWFLCTFLFVGNTAIVVPRHLLVALVPLAFAAAAAVDVLAQRSRVAAALLVAGVAAWMFVPLEPVLAARHNRCGPADFARAVGRATPEGATVLAMDLAPHIEYFARRRTYVREALAGDALDEARIERALATVRDLHARGVPVFAASDAFAYDVPDPAQGFVIADTGGEAGPGGAQETLGRFGIALVGVADLRLVLTSWYEDFHDAALGPREGARPTAYLYAVEPRK